MNIPLPTIPSPQVVFHEQPVAGGRGLNIRCVYTPWEGAPEFQGFGYVKVVDGQADSQSYQDALRTAADQMLAAVKHHQAAIEPVPKD